MRILLDANILFSAAKSDRAVRRFLHELKAAGFTLVADGYVAGEARRNLEAKFPTALGDFEKVLDMIEASPVASRPLGADVAPGLPEKDRPVLAAAIQRRCQILLTGDRTHFGKMFGQRVEGVEIQSTANLARKLTEPQS